ncbi:MAG: monovalent cation/H+ antiporter subunit D family protein, partial [Rhodospirillales bacterium]|nr:monovalent cation/H+ antiporter subunit D family protein [Rhodospirillales bacterium]
MSPEIAIALSIIIPLVGAVLIGLCDRWPDLRETVTMVTAGALFAVVVMILPQVAAGGRPELVLLELFPGLDIKFTVEPLGMLFALIASGLWIVTSIYSIGYMRGHEEENQTRFYVCFAIALAAAMGVAHSGNM